ncbi:hypothetical protein [Rufibacter quisquiliarum]|uniref:DUF4153 domain-containing protein n=1 Tax=Rufibacter quisquiliarum TaxID=1549639 RepID=A0A839GT53_9BACT|nr:hypothetical protein [Rufibacter quisquiliarum]MBA9078655.1 hypothetical protein [Rufibacter quisquiliarum]
MKEQIRISLNDPKQLEKLYRENKASFRREFSALYPEVKGTALADFWNERLHYQTEELTWGTSRELVFVIVAALVAGFIAKIPALFSIHEAYFYPRNIGFIIFPALTAYFAWKNKLSAGTGALLVGATLAGLLFINWLPATQKSDTLLLSCVHLLLFLWSILGVSFVGRPQNSLDRRLGYLRYNGDLLVMTTLIVLAGGIMTGVTIGLFSLIGFQIEEFYFQNVVVFGLPAAPILGTYLTQTNPQLVGKVSPVIARIFSPLVLIMLVIYLAAMVYSGKDPYNDREFLLIFNALLVGVMAIIFFSVAETSTSGKGRAEVWVLFFLSAVTVLVNGLALSAILFRITEWGITPNRAAVLGGNLLMLLNLLWVTSQLYRVLLKKSDLTQVGKPIAVFLPLYVVWTIIVTFLFPLLFGFR